MKGLSPWDTAHAASSGSSNPFIDDNSFSTQSQRDPRVQAALRSYQAPGTLSAPFGSPVAGPIPPNGSAAFQEVPLYSTPTSASSATGAWPAHAIAASTGGLFFFYCAPTNFKLLKHSQNLVFLGQPLQAPSHHHLRLRAPIRAPPGSILERRGVGAPPASRTSCRVPPRRTSTIARLSWHAEKPRWRVVRACSTLPQ